MATIGIMTYNKTKDTYTGRINLPGFKAKVTLAPNSEKNGETHPDYRLICDGVEIGGGWAKIAKTSKKEYVSVKIDVPQFATAVYANLNQSEAEEDTFLLYWSR